MSDALALGAVVVLGSAAFAVVMMLVLAAGALWGRLMRRGR